MRVVFAVVAVLAVTTLSGCADESFLVDAQEEPAAVDAPVARVDAKYMVPVTPYTAPEAIDLDRYEEGNTVVRLVAGADGLACISEAPNEANPAGFKVVGAWTKCHLTAHNKTFATAHADARTADLPLLDQIPVDLFTWHASVGLLVQNNTGTHRMVLAELEREQDAAPDGGAYAVLDNWSFEVCDAPDAVEAAVGPQGVENVLIEAYGHNGQTSFEVDLSDYEVLDIESTHEYTFEEGVLRALGDWGHDTWMSFIITIDFEADELQSLLLPLCGGAGEKQSMQLLTRTDGIAGGWLADYDEQFWFFVGLFGVDPP